MSVFQFQFVNVQPNGGNAYSYIEFLVNQTGPNWIPKTEIWISSSRIPNQRFRMPILKSYSSNQTDPNHRWECISLAIQALDLKSAEIWTRKTSWIAPRWITYRNCSCLGSSSLVNGAMHTCISSPLRKPFTHCPRLHHLKQICLSAIRFLARASFTYLFWIPNHAKQ